MIIFHIIIIYINYGLPNYDILLHYNNLSLLVSCPKMILYSLEIP
jgi:hypothetical protein